MAAAGERPAGPPRGPDQLSAFAAQQPAAPGEGASSAPLNMIAAAVCPTVGSATGVLFDDDFGSMARSVSDGWQFGATDVEGFTWAPYEGTISETQPTHVYWSLPNGTYQDFGALTDAQPLSSGLRGVWAGVPMGIQPRRHQFVGLHVHGDQLRQLSSVQAHRGPVG